MQPDREIVKVWLDEFNGKIRKLIDDEIKDVDGDIMNEHIWELAHEGEDPNPHTQNIANKELYKMILNYMKTLPIL